MSCRNFEAIITELAREQILESEIKAAAHLHLQTCKACAARLSAEQSLSAGLRALAANVVEPASTPLRDASLVSAFRQSPLVVQRTASVGTRTSEPKWSAMAIAAAATILVVAAFAVFEFVLNKRNGPLRQASTTTAQSPLSTTRSNTDIQQNTSIGQEDQEILEALPPVSSDSGRSHGLLRDAGYKARPRATSLTASSKLGSSDEIATDFLPLSYGTNLSQLDDGQVVRVELPRSALQSLGFPMNAERSSERVKADVLLGHDGVARAIRFVR